MADLIEGIAQLLAAQGVGVWSPDADYADTDTGILHTVVPAKPDTVIVLALYPGGDVGGEHPVWRLPRLQVRVRATADPRDALALDEAAHDVLHGLSHTTLPNGVRLTDCYSLASVPLPMGQDKNGRHEFARNYQLTID